MRHQGRMRCARSALEAHNASLRQHEERVLTAGLFLVRSTAIGSSPPARKETHRTERCKGENLFKAKLVLPPVRQIILRQPGLLEAEVKITQSDLARVIVEDDPTNASDPIRLFLDEKLMKMLIRPAKHTAQRSGNKSLGKGKTQSKHHSWFALRAFQWNVLICLHGDTGHLLQKACYAAG